MLLKSLQPFLSINEIGPIELPSFTVIVGLNGVGKSHLLQGIEQGQLSVDILGERMPGIPPDDANVVRLVNGQVVFDTSSANSAIGSSGSSPRPGIVHPGPQSLGQHRLQSLFPLNSELLELLEGSPVASDEVELTWRASGSSIAERSAWPIEDNRRSRLDDLFARADVALTAPSPQNPMFQFGATVKRAAERLSVSPREVTQEDLATLDSWGPYRQFNPQLPTLFAHYRDERHKNDLQRGYDVQEGTNKFLEVKQFLEKFGRPPWEELSDLLAEFDLDFQVAPPSLRLGDPIELRLQTLDGKASVEFHALSSGEKILFQLATALLKVDPVRAIIMRPKLLLLDEMDASLHPKVLHRWIGVLREKVVNGLGITCILTTHSPITVALAPEESLFEMVRAEPRIAKVNKREALNRLTVGLPALSVDYSGRRQVFVEADTDAGSYDRLHTLLKADLQLPLSLNFLSTGIKRGKDELGTGCDAVRTIVGKLEEFGNISTFGLVDWDGQARSEGRVHVLGPVDIVDSQTG